ncbi:MULTISPECIES: AraC family transcriptional regulator [Sinorhizobium]|uniref:AraC family transcriptional regulator n=2 Tax=Sinorhizobium TaxID=28105 RepID=A0A2S3YT94_9HYPH|nr:MULTISPECIES: AraC family transcriptional regulator [Sinorhizobium]AUX79531.1 AraC family transcriptional regulator protein [Sinorhizobium fredii]PDT37075.1 AraC family transcriptional regulator [Sinorhizobium sp. FG01]POH34858.1 AraC family transcriptional regulator [Sinorhizobium americanum]
MALGDSATRPDWVSFEGRDPDRLAATLTSWVSSVVVRPLGRESIYYNCAWANAGILSIGCTHIDGRILFESEADGQLVLIVPLRGGVDLRMGRQAFCTSPGRGAVIEGDRRIAAQSLSAREHMFVAIDRAALLRQLCDIVEMPVSGALEFSPELDLLSGPGTAIASMAETLRAGLTGDAPLRRSPLALTNLSEALIQLLLDTVPHRFSERMRRAVSPVPRHVKKAVDFMMANLSRPITLVEVAAACGVSSRTLQQGFRQFKMTTPMSYLQDLRLKALREELTQAWPGQSVADIALKWGFTHMGRLATDYRNRFGELPSQTLRSC